MLSLITAFLFSESECSTSTSPWARHSPGGSNALVNCETHPYTPSRLSQIWVTVISKVTQVCIIVHKLSVTRLTQGCVISLRLLYVLLVTGSKLEPTIFIMLCCNSTSRGTGWEGHCVPSVIFMGNHSINYAIRRRPISCGSNQWC